MMVAPLDIAALPPSLFEELGRVVDGVAALKVDIHALSIPRSQRAPGGSAFLECEYGQLARSTAATDN